MVSVIELTHLYNARGSFDPLRQKNTTKLLTQSALGQIWLGNGLYQVGRFIFSATDGPFLTRFFRGRERFETDPWKVWTNSVVRGPSNKLYAGIEKVNFREIDPTYLIFSQFLVSWVLDILPMSQGSWSILSWRIMRHFRGVYTRIEFSVCTYKPQKHPFLGKKAIFQPFLDQFSLEFLIRWSKMVHVWWHEACLCTKH